MHATQLPAAVLLRPAGPDDVGLLTDLVAGLSPTSTFQRFLAPVRMPDATLVAGLLRGEGRRGALLAVRADGREEALGHACWSVTPDDVVDVGVLVADRVQGRGIGTALFLVAVDAARAAGARTLHLDVHPDNRRLVAALRRRLGKGAFAFRSGLISIDVPVDALPLQAAVPVAA